MRLAPASLEAWLPDLRHLRGVRVWGPPAARDRTACVSAAALAARSVIIGRRNLARYGNVRRPR